MRMKKLKFNIILYRFLDDKQRTQHEIQKSVDYSCNWIDAGMMNFNKKNLDLVLAQYREKTENQISCVSNQEKLKGVVVLCEEKVVDDVDFVVQESTNAIVVITRVQPKVDVGVPVLVLSEKEFIEVMKFGIQDIKVDLECFLNDNDSSLASDNSFCHIFEIDEDFNSSEFKAENISELSITSAPKEKELQADSIDNIPEQLIDSKCLNFTETDILEEEISDVSFPSKQIDLDFELKPNKVKGVLEYQPTASKVAVPKDDSSECKLENLHIDPIKLTSESKDSGPAQSKKVQVDSITAEKKTVDDKLMSETKVNLDKEQLQCFLGDDNFHLNTYEGSYYTSGIGEDLNDSESKTEKITDSSISHEFKLKNVVAKIDSQSRTNKDNSSEDNFCKTKEEELQAYSMKSLLKQPFDLKDNLNFTELKNSEVSFPASQVGLDSVPSPSKKARVHGSQSTTIKVEVHKDDSVECKFENMHTDQIKLAFEKGDVSPAKSKNVKADSIIVEEKTVDDKLISKTEVVLEETNTAMYTFEKTEQSKKASNKYNELVKVYASYSKETLKFVKKVQFTSEIGESLFKGSFKIVKAICNRNKDGEVCDICNKDEIKKAVVLCEEPNPNHIEVIVKKLVACGGLALFVKDNSYRKLSSSIPIFLLSKSQINALLNQKDISVRFELLSERTFENSSPTRKPPMKFSANEKVAPKKRGFFRYYFTFQSEVKDELEKIIQPHCNWLFNIDSFHCGLKILAIAKKSNNSAKEINEIQRQLMAHLTSSHFKVDLMILTFAANVFWALSEFSYHRKEIRNLESSIVKCIEKINLDQSDDKLTEIMEESSKTFLPLGEYVEWKLVSLEQEQIKEQTDDMIRKLVWILFNLCGFNWNDLIRIYEPLKCLEPHHRLNKILDISSFSSLLLCVQPTLVTFLKTYECLRETVNRNSKEVNAPICVHQEVAVKLGVFLTKQKEIEPKLFDHVFQCIEGLRFTKNEDAHRNIMSKIVGSLHNDLDRIESLWKKIHVDYSYHHLLKDEISNRLRYLFCRRYDYYVPKAHTFIKLHHSTMRSFISYHDTCVYVKKLMEVKREEKMEDKLIVLKIVYKNFAGKEESISSFIMNCLEQVLFPCSQSHFYHLENVLCFFHFISSNTDTFYTGEKYDQELFRSIAKKIFQTWNIEQDSGVLNELPNCKRDGALLNHLLNELQINLNLFYNEIEKAIRLHNKHASKSKEPLKSILGKMMENAIELWNPTNVIDLLRLDASSLSFLERSLDATSKSYIIRKICEDWCFTFNSNNVTLLMIEKVLDMCDKKKSKLLKIITGVDLVSKNNLSETRNEIINLISSIQRDSSSVISRGKKSKRQLLLDVFERFNCNIKRETCDVVSLLFKCKEFEHTNLSKANESFFISDIQLIAKNIRTFRHKFDDQIKTSSYFLSVDCKLFYDAVGIRFWESSFSIEDFLHMIKRTETELLSLIKCNGNAPFSMIKKAPCLVLNEGRDFKNDVRLLAQCPTFDISDNDSENFFFLSSIVTLASELESFVELCKQFQFQIIKDSNFDILTAISHRLISDDALVWSLCQWKDMSSELSNLLFSSESKLYSHEDIENLNNLLTTLNLLSRHADTWKFMGEMKWFGVEGLKQFYKEYSNVTNQLLFASSESFESNVLDTLEPTVRLLSLVGDLSKDFLKDFFMTASQRDNIGLYKPDEMQRNLRMIQQNLTSIQEWFDGGVDEMIAIFSRFNLAWKCGRYIICCEELCMMYQSGDKKESLSGSALNEFVQQLGFVQHENPEISAQISSFIDQFYLLQKIVQMKIQAARVGYMKTSLDSFSYSIDQDATNATHLLMETKNIHQQCNAWLKEIRMNHPLSTLLCTQDLRRIYNAMNEKDMDVILFGLSIIIPPHIIMSMFYDARRAAQECIDDDSKQVDTLSEKSWIEVVSFFIERWHKVMKEPRFLTNAKKIKSRNGIFLHSFHCNEDKKSTLCLAAMRHIFKDGLPESFQIFDAMFMPDSNELALFLDRVLLFPSYTFVLLNVQNLSGVQQETVANFMSDSAIIGKQINFHCFQHSETILHASPWVDPIVWSDRNLQQEPFSSLKKEVVNGTFIVDIILVATASSGTGKSRFIRNELKAIQKGEQNNMDIITICIHEGSDLHSLVTSLRNCPSHKLCKVGVYFSFMFPLESAGKEKLAMLNYFFNHLLLTRSIYDPISCETFVMGWSKWNIFVELQESEDNLENFIPILKHCSTSQPPPKEFQVDNKTKRVCMYLRAFKDGTINRKFEPVRKKQLMFVIDESGSMNGWPIKTAICNAVKIFDSHIHIGDIFGTILFNHDLRTLIPLKEIFSDKDKLNVRNTLNGICSKGGGTDMYIALSKALTSLQRSSQIGVESWIVCLTDGISSSKGYDAFRRSLLQSAPNIHLAMIGINLSPDYQQQLRDICSKFGSAPTQGIFVPSEANVEDMNKAFGQVAAHIPVSQTFELDGILSMNDCWRLINEYLPKQIKSDDMLGRKFWIEFLYRRIKVFDKNEHFNYNETYEELGSSLMQVMLHEAEHLLSANHSMNWRDSNHEQLIYDFAKPDAPEFRLICTAPEKMTKESITRFESLNLPGFRIPKSEELRQRQTLDLFLSQALSIPLTEDEADGSRRLSCIDNNRFVLTLDFTLKLLNIHERVACNIPCVIEGETGVSKTALTKMYSILRNSSLNNQICDETRNALESIVGALKDDNYFSSESDGPPLDVIRSLLVDATDGTMTSGSNIEKRIYQLLIDKSNERKGLFKELPKKFKGGCVQGNKMILELLEWFAIGDTEEIFFELNVDASLKEIDIVRFFKQVRIIAKKIFSSGGIVVVFLDEVNTSTIIGLFKEITVDRTICGEVLEDNIVIVSACNPAGRTSLSLSNLRESDLAKNGFSGHYQVNTLPLTMDRLKWEYGALNAEQEKEFVYRRIEMIDKKQDLPNYLIAELTEFVTASQEMIRVFAAKDIKKGLEKCQSSSDIEEETNTRARSAVSLRDIQRVFNLFQFFTEDISFTNGNENELYRDSMFLAIAVVYYFRLNSESRELFLQRIANFSEDDNTKNDFTNVLNNAMTKVVKESEIPHGIALTDGLKEIIFMTLVCSLSLTPLVIVGPPGCSKTLSVNIVDDNANGIESITKFYRRLPRLSTFHYQCSKTSTSREVASVFDKAIQRQLKVDLEKHKCLVFMDEAGLPEEDKESLKVLHYYLEGHMSTKAKVGFVAITNHVLDAAKSNRCVSLLRQEPDDREMMQIVIGVLYKKGDNSFISLDGTRMEKKDFASRLCSAYKKILHLNDGKFETFYGLRDFIYLLKYIEQRFEVDKLMTVVKTVILVRALERNFNGVDNIDLKVIVNAFLGQCFKTNDLIPDVQVLLRSPIDVVSEALLVEETSNTRYALIIDDSDDDSIMRLLKSEGLLDISKKTLFKLSNMPENATMERLSLVSGVKFAALQGSRVVLSQTDAVNESFYDLFNQHFRCIPNRDGVNCLYANIAVGGVSRRSKISSSFRCIVHVRKSDLENLPAPFLNRFEKFRLSVRDLLFSKIHHSPMLTRILERSLRQIQRFVLQLNLCGFVEGHTVESCILNLLSDAIILRQNTDDDSILHSLKPERQTFVDCLISFISISLNVSTSNHDIASIIELGKKYLPTNQSETLERLNAKPEITNIHNMKECFKECMKGKPKQTLALLTEYLIEILITKNTISTLLELATPEEIFTKRNCVPADIIEQYFQQQHFSLKSILKKLQLKSSLRQSNYWKFIVHTRSNTQIVSMPSSRPDICCINKSNIIERLISSDGNSIMIEHLQVLKNEAAVRSAIDNWAGTNFIDTFLLIVDMSNRESIERVNFVRCCVDQHQILEGKTFLFILYYPPSSFLTRTFYPSSFLDNWKHTFLDNIGDNSKSPIDMKHLIEKACGTHGADFDKGDIHKITESIMAETIKGIASHNIFYPKQISEDTFHARHSILIHILSSNIYNTNISGFVCSKFNELWSKRNLIKMLRRASWNLTNGASQLGLTSCLKGIMQNAMTTFLLHYISFMNEWKNFDLLTTCRSRDTDGLFLRILQTIPPIPFDELILQKNDYEKPRRELPQVINPQAMFPFFSLISTLLDKVVVSVLPEISCAVSQNISWCKHPQRVLEDSMFELQNSQNKDNIALMVITHIKEQSSNKSTALYDRYLNQFMTWKLCLSIDSVPAKWFQDTLFRLVHNGKDQHHKNLIWIHVCARVYEMELLRVSSMDNKPFLTIPQEEIKKIFSRSHNFNGVVAIKAFIDWLFKNLPNSEDHILGNCKWMDVFKIFWRRLSDILGDECVTDNDLAHQLRILSFVYILGKYSKVPQTPQMLKGLNTTMVSFARFMNDRESDPNIRVLCIEKLQEHFFSSQWLKNCGLHWESDISFLMNSVSKGDNCDLLVKSIWNACKYGVVLERKCSRDGRSSAKFLNLSTSRLVVINRHLRCNGLSRFLLDGQRLLPPPFIPRFAVTNLVQNDGNIEDTCFTNDKLAQAVYQIVLYQIIELSEDKSSEQVLLAYMKDVEKENILKQKRQIELQKVRDSSHVTDHQISFVGSSLAMLIIEARRLCFVLKVSHDIAHDLPVAAMNGFNSEIGKIKLNQAMSTPEMQNIFMLNIIRQKGQSKLFSLLSTGGTLHGLEWTREWSGGLPTVRNNVKNKLAKAETELHASVIEEERKAREFRLCPHCKQPFIILERNCGRFVCGRASSHTTPINGPNGCGIEFQESNALYYKIDNTILGPLRDAVDQERQKVKKYHKMSKVWDQLKSASLPILSSKLNGKNHFAPISSVLESIGNESDMIRHLIYNRAKVDKFRMLPELIEFYLWLHSTFTHIISSNQAESLQIGDIMKKDVLSNRFEPVHVKHMLSLFEKVKDKLNTHLKQCNFQSNWDCETFEIPFKKIEDASLLSLLSVFDHPTDGFDFLYIIINQLVGQFNEFILRLYKDQEKTELFTHRPKALLYRSPVALALEALRFISSDDLPITVESFRVVDKDEYNVNELENTIIELLSPCNFTIDNPMKHLRTKFNFMLREEIMTAQESSKEIVGFKCSNGWYFAHYQDFRLFESCQTLIQQSIVHTPTTKSLQHTFKQKFYNMDYEQLRSILEGTRNALKTSRSNSFTFEDIKKCKEDDSATALSEIGFPLLSTSQAQLILSLTTNQIVEFVQYIGYQLASESYHYSMFPLSMNTAISNPTKKKLHDNLITSTEKEGSKYIRKKLQEFRTDILCFYEGVIRDQCASSNDGMKSFLESNNFCDDSDPIFTVLPEAITIRNYVALHQELHQFMHILIANERKTDCEDEEDSIGRQNMDLSYAKSVRGNCWLFQEKKSNVDEIQDDQNLNEDVYGDKMEWDKSSICSSDDLNEFDDLWYKVCLKNDAIEKYDNENDGNEDEEMSFHSISDRSNDEFIMTKMVMEE